MGRPLASSPGRWCRIAAFVLAAAGWFAPAALAQDGYRVRAFFLQPELTTETGYDSNLLGVPRGGSDALYIRLAPELVLRSGWSRHALSLEIGAETAHHFGSSADDYLDAHARLAGEFDVTRRLRFQLAFAARRGHDARRSEDLPLAAAEPALFTEFAIEAGTQIRLSRLSFAPFATVRWLDFDDVTLIGGGIEEQDRRDRREAEAGIEVGVRAAPNWQPFMRLAAFDVAYDRVNGSHSGASALAGLDLRLNDLIEGRLAVGASHRDFADPAHDNRTAFVGEAAFIWRPTRRWTIGLDASRSWQETTLPGASARILEQLGLALGYELTRRWDLAADLGVSRDDWRGIARTDTGWQAGVAARFSPMRGLTIGPAYGFTRHLSTTPGQGFTSHALSFTATYRPGARE